ncbi:hypothetical protein MIND_00798200 [Mycena indigotica]|uniref:Uncharacterized protein n=1 Tax=Mycena indigotica TaxID=2126181 RepID=A0A8H6SPD4_9AGAR|nr:uncharacterized protein MIND_00798200 [Mycena indigotica]KAF7302306.1 hypothetical protein MIND_00798200 [Mycena indigotica]
MLFLLLSLSSIHSRAAPNDCTNINDWQAAFRHHLGLSGDDLSLHLGLRSPKRPRLLVPSDQGKRLGHSEAGLKWHVVSKNGPLLHRLKLMSVVLSLRLSSSLASPARQFLMARSFSRDYGVSLTHGFFIGMGGFVDDDGHPIVTKEQLSTPNAIQLIRAIDESDIEDKSKGDVFSKGIALCQGLWFIAQCIARRLQHLPLTELEVATLAFAALNALTWLLWLGKPLDVRNPIKLSVQTAPPDHTPLLPYPASTYWLDRFLSLFINSYSNDEYDPWSNTSVPTFWCTTFDYYNIVRSSSRADWLSWTLADSSQFLCGGLFGAIHCIAWRATFPSPAEMWLWRGAALVLTVLPPLFLGATFLLSAFRVDVAGQVLGFVCVYSIARGILLVIPFVTLRSLPPAAFGDVDWSVYIPHL